MTVHKIFRQFCQVEKCYAQPSLIELENPTKNVQRDTEVQAISWTASHYLFDAPELDLPLFAFFLDVISALVDAPILEMTWLSLLFVLVSKFWLTWQKSSASVEKTQK